MVRPNAFTSSSTLLVALTLACTLGGVACASPDHEAKSDESNLTSCGDGPAVTGEIEAKYVAIGGCDSDLGAPVHEVRPTPDGRGQFAAFTNGSIYWRADLGAHVVGGYIAALWESFKWEAGPLGYPLNDETLTPDGGRFNIFEGGSVYWSMATGAHEVRGAIRDEWAARGWETGPLGYPATGELEVPGGIRSDFQHGSITWSRESHGLTVVINGDNVPSLTTPQH